jgi:integration host factor subunit alpha
VLIFSDGDGGGHVPALTKARIAQNLAATNVFTMKESVQIVEALFEIIKQTLEQGEGLLISRFGRFCVRQKQQRRGRNPHSGQSLTLSSRRVVTFKCSAKLREKVNREGGKHSVSGTTRR